MTTLEMSEDEMVRALMRQYDVPREYAEKAVRDYRVERDGTGVTELIRGFAHDANVRSGRALLTLNEQARTARDLIDRAAPDCRTVARWLDITAPFSLLVADGARFAVVGGKLILTKRYRRAKAKLHDLAMAQCAKWHPYDGPVRVEARLSFPPDAKRRDAPNYAKMVHDALAGVCYHDDSQIHDSHWVRAPDSDEPQLCFTVFPLTTGT